MVYTFIMFLLEKAPKVVGVEWREKVIMILNCRVGGLSRIVEDEKGLFLEEWVKGRYYFEKLEQNTMGRMDVK